jgi:hypothetical protein
MRLDDFDEVARLVKRRNEIMKLDELLFGSSIHCTITPHYLTSGQGSDATKHCDEYWLRGVLAGKYKELVAGIDECLKALGVEVE